ncbi:hypothetical protein [Parasphingorhabdus sp.]|uniref:hypothetical protein n=1 Tax=Parasphingorhabdus sp. TaxID=2709688 RepID=UPI003BB16E10
MERFAVPVEVCIVLSVAAVEGQRAGYMTALPETRSMNNADIAEYNSRANNSYLVVLGSFVLCLSDTGIDV